MASVPRASAPEAGARLSGERRALLKDLSILGAVVVVVVVLVIASTVWTLLRFLRGVVDRAERGLGPAGSGAARAAGAPASYRQEAPP